MNDFQRIKSDTFVTIANTFLKDKNLSNKAKGVLAMILSLPDDWDFSIKGMVAITKDGEASLRSAINEMKENGYCAMKPVRIANKIARWQYLFSGEKLTEELLCDFLQLENLNVGNQAQYNNIKNINNKGINKKNIIISKKEPEQTSFLEPAEDERKIRFNSQMKKLYPNIMGMKSPLTYEESQELKKRFTDEEISNLLMEMENYAQLHKKCNSAYLTFLNWHRRNSNKKQVV